jgi:uncharacterized protein YndB with AHSA1/START domain
MSKKKEPLPPVVVNVAVELPIERAFDLFTRGIGDWWPLATHSVGEEKAQSVHLEPRVGGRIVETDDDGTRHLWGEVIECVPPRKIVFTWHPGRAPETQQTIEVLFEADGDLTHVELVHGDWEVFEQEADAMRERYTTGWAKVLGECYVSGVATRA